MHVNTDTETDLHPPDLPGLHVLCFLALRCRPGGLVCDLLLQFNQGLQILLLLLLLLLIAGQDEEQTQDALQVPLTHLCT